MFICDCCKKLCDMMDMFGTEDDDYHVCYSCANKLGFLHEKMEREAKSIEMNHDLYAQTVKTLTLNYEALVIERYGKDVLLSTSPKIVEALFELYQSMLLTQMQILEKEQPKFKGLVAYHERANKLSNELESMFTDISNIKEQKELESTAPDVSYTKEEENIEGLGGWLFFVGLGIVFSPLIIIAQTFSMCSDIFSNGTWEALTTQGLETYNSFWKPIVLGEIAVNCGSVFAWIFIGFLFFSKKKIFPKWYIGILIFSLVFIFVDALLIKLILSSGSIFDNKTKHEFSRALIFTVIWSWYMLVSKRVKVTFVN